MSINNLLAKLKFLESQIKEAIEEAEDIKGKAELILNETPKTTYFGMFTGSATKQTDYNSYPPTGLPVERENSKAQDEWDEFMQIYEKGEFGLVSPKVNPIEEQKLSETSEQKLYFICAQPNTKYYAWQLEVMLRNFNEMGILSNPKYEVHIVTNIPYGDNLLVESELFKLSQVEKSHTNLIFYYHPDTRTTKHYPSSIRPNLLKRHFAAHPEIKTFFYHDCDMIFTKKDLDFTPFLQDDICYGSDVRFYIGHDYIAGKEHNVLEYMCQIAQIPLRVVRDNEHNCIGAQYLIKNVTADFWEEVEKISEELFLKITTRNNYIKAQNPQYHELQIFASDMWAVLWCLWKLGKQTVPHKFFDFAWATDTIERYNECNIYHNAGVTESGHGLFFKGEFQDKVPDKNLRVNPHSACSPYYELVKQIMIVK